MEIISIIGKNWQYFQGKIDVIAILFANCCTEHEVILMYLRLRNNVQRGMIK
jgi:hypothetical protein